MATKTVYNRGQRRFKIGVEKDKAGKIIKDIFLEPGQSLEVDEAVATQLLHYDGIIDASKMVKSGKKSADLEKENAVLLKKIDDLEKRIAKLLEEAEQEKGKKKDKK